MKLKELPMIVKRRSKWWFKTTSMKRLGTRNEDKRMEVTSLERTKSNYYPLQSIAVEELISHNEDVPFDDIQPTLSSLVNHI